MIPAGLQHRIGLGETNNEEDIAVISRPSATALFCISSVDRSSPDTTSPYNFSISKPNNLLSGFFTRMALTEIVLPYYIPNVNVNTSTLNWAYGSSSGQITLSTGFYTAVDLAASLQTQLRTATSNPYLTCAYSQLGQFFISTVTATPLRLTRTSPSFCLWDMLGGTPVWTAGNIVLFGKITRARYTEWIDIVCSQLTDNQHLKDATSSNFTRDILARVYIEGENDQITPVYQVSTSTTATPYNISIPGTYPISIYRQYRNPKQIKWNKIQNLGALKFECYDSRGQPLNIPGLDNVLPDWSMTLLISED